MVDGPMWQRSKASAARFLAGLAAGGAAAGLVLAVPVFLIGRLAGQVLPLSICAKVIDGKARNIYARYHHAPRVEIDADVALTRRGSARFTTEIVEVTSFDNGVVNVRYPTYDDGA